MKVSPALSRSDLLTTAPASPVATQAPDAAVTAAHLAALDAQQGAATTSASAGLGIVHDELEINVRLTRAPVADVHVGQALGTNLATTGVTLGQADAGVSLTRTAALMALPLNTGTGLVGHIGSVSGLLYGSISQPLGGNTALTAWGGHIGTASAAGLGATTTLANVNLSSGIAFVGSGDATLKIEQYHQGRMQLAYADQITGSIQLTGGISLGYVGFGMRLGINAERSFEYKTWMTPPDVARLLRGVSRTQERLSALRLRRHLIALPNLTDPLNENVNSGRHAPFRVGDEMRLTYGGSLIGGLAITGAGIYAGMHISVAGTHTIRVIKTSATEVCIDVTPRQVSRAVCLSLDLPLAAAITAVLAQSKATRHSYVFDLTQPHALEAYLQALKGVLPGPVVSCKGWHTLATDEAQRFVNEASLPEGVSYNVLEQAAVPLERTRGASMTLPKHLPFTNLAGLGVERREIREESIIADGELSIHNDSLSHIKETQMLHRGTRETTAFGTLTTARRSTDMLASVEGVLLGVTFSNDRTRRDSRNAIIATLNRVVFKDAPLPLFTGPKQVSKYNYELTVQRYVSSEALARLAPEGRSVREQALRLQREVATRGIHGLTDLVARMGDDPADMTFTVESRAHEALRDKVLQLSARYDKSINPTTQPRSEINGRIRKVHKYLQLIKVVEQDMEQDALFNRLDPQHKTLVGVSLRATHDALTRLIVLKDMRPNLYAHLVKKSPRSVRKILQAWKQTPPTRG